MKNVFTHEEKYCVFVTSERKSNVWWRNDALGAKTNSLAGKAKDHNIVIYSY